MRMLYHIQRIERQSAAIWDTIILWREAQASYIPAIEAAPSSKKNANQMDLLLWAFNKLKRAQQKAQQQILDLYTSSLGALARRYQGPHIDRDELVQVGRVSLLKAISKFDPTKGMSFWQYAGKWAYADMKRHIEQTQGLIVTPANVRTASKAIDAMQHKMQLREKREVTREEAACMLGLDPDKYPPATHETSIDAELDGGESLHSLIAASDSSPEELDCVAVEHLHKAVASLPDKYRIPVSEAYGLTGKPKTLEEIGKQLNVTREWARQLILRGVARLRQQLGFLEESCAL